MKFAICLILAAAPAAFAVTDLRLIVAPPADDRVAPGGEVTYIYTVTYAGNGPIDLRLVHQLPPGGHFVSAAGTRWNCAESEGAVVCTRDFYFFSFVDPNENPLALTIAAPDDPSGQRFRTTTTLEDRAGDPPAPPVSVNMTVYRTFDVTTPGDAGAGTLREAISRANGGCDASIPCLIRFAQPMRIVPQTPLPTVTACGLLIEGGPYDPRSRNRSFDVARRVEISGASLSAGSGFTLAARCGEGSLRNGTTLRALSINGFPENGVELRAPNVARAIIEGCFIGTDPAGQFAVPNTRGISVVTADGWIDVTDCLIAGNARSGIALWAGGPIQSHLQGNLIGVRFGGAPLPNGGSGVFVNGGAVSSERNAIEYNGEFGVAVGNAEHFFSQYDYIVNNGGIAVDWGLNGPGPGARMPGVPQLTGAVYDAATNTTLVTGTLLVDTPLEYYDVEFFASSGDFQGGVFIGSRPLGLGDTASKPFVAQLRGNWSGTTITAHSLRRHQADGGALDSSELSAGIVAR